MSKTLQRLIKYSNSKNLMAMMPKMYKLLTSISFVSILTAILKLHFWLKISISNSLAFCFTRKAMSA